VPTLPAATLIGESGLSPRIEAAAPPAALPVGAPSEAAVAAANARMIAEAIALGTMRDRIELRLDPPELGRVSIDMTMDGNTVSATVSAERPETLDLLRRHVDMLQRELGASGFGSADIGFADRRAGGQGREGLPDGAPEPSLQPVPPRLPVDVLTRAREASGRLDIRL
jgi:hypothetical protein